MGRLSAERAEGFATPVANLVTRPHQISTIKHHPTSASTQGDAMRRRRWRRRWRRWLKTTDDMMPWILIIHFIHSTCRRSAAMRASAGQMKYVPPRHTSVCRHVRPAQHHRNTNTNTNNMIHTNTSMIVR